MLKLEVVTFFGTVYFAGFDAKKKPVFVNPDKWFFGKMPEPMLFATAAESKKVVKKLELDKSWVVAYHHLVEV